MIFGRLFDLLIESSEAFRTAQTAPHFHYLLAPHVKQPRRAVAGWGEEQEDTITESYLSPICFCLLLPDSFSSL